MILPILISAFLFYLSFPNIFFLQGFSSFAWIFAVPLFFALDKKTIWGRIRLGFLFGLLSNLAVVNWMIPYSFLGYLLLSIALTSQAVVFAILYMPTQHQRFVKIIYVPCTWVASEFLRKLLMMGQSWDLAHSQSFDIHLLQSARVFGSAGISFALIFVNYLFYVVLFGLQESRPQSKKIATQKKLIVITIFVFAVLIYGYGFFSIERHHQPQSVYKICILQPNIDYHGELSLGRVKQIVDDQIALTERALKDAKPDLVVWPETAIPTDFLKDSLLKDKMVAFVQAVDVPFLIGAVIEDKDGLHNSAVLLDQKGAVKKVYYKRHLIPLTEYIPSTLFWRMIAKVFHVESPGLVAGEDSGLMEITSRSSGDKTRFGVAICSEDNVAQVFRQYRNQGAGFVVVLLNNGWFAQKAGLVMHAQHSVIHAVENHISVLRIANTGLSGLIDQSGRLGQESLDNLEQRTFCHYDIAVNLTKKNINNLVDTFCIFCLVFVIMAQLYWFVMFYKKKEQGERG